MATPVTTSTGTAPVQGLPDQYVDMFARWAKRKWNKLFGTNVKLTSKVGGKGTDVISLKDNTVRVEPDTRQKTALFNEFVEEKNPSIHRAKLIKKGQVKDLGDHHMPVQNFTLWNGIENGSFKVAPIEQFNDTTLVFPVRNIKRGTKPIQQIYINPRNKNTNAIFGITVDNDTVPFSAYGTGILDTKKMVLGNSSGNSLFIGDFTQLSPEQFDMVNEHLKTNPSYPVRTDLGSYELYRTNNPSYWDYMSQFVENLNTYNPESMYVVGTR